MIEQRVGGVFFTGAAEVEVRIKVGENGRFQFDKCDESRRPFLKAL